MTRETRFNLIFLLILIPLLLPGGIMLFRAKLDPNARRMFKPDVIRAESVYINYDDQRPNAPRIVPPITGQWIQFEGQRLIRPDLRPLMHWLYGVASENYRYEAVAMSASDEAGSFLAVITWDPRIVEPVFTLDGQAMSQINHFTIAVSPQVRNELQKAGFVNPPENIHAYLLQTSLNASGKTLAATYTTPSDKTLTEKLVLPTVTPAGQE
jgi:hypothetical protein